MSNQGFDVQDYTKEAQKKTGATKILGELCYWGVDSALEVQNPGKFRADWIAAGLPAKVVPTKVSYRTALARAVKKWTSHKKSTLLGKSQKYICEITEENANQLIYTIDVLDTNKDLVLSGAKLTAQLDKRNGVLVCTDMDLIQFYNDYKPIFINSDIQRICMALVKWCNGVRTMKGSPMYFVPEGSNTAELKKGCDFLNTELGSVMVRWPVADLDSAKEAAWVALQNEITVELKMLEREFEQDGKDKTMRPETISKRMSHLADLQEKVDLYADTLKRGAGQAEKHIKSLAEKYSAYALKKGSSTNSQEGDKTDVDSSTST